MQRFTIQDIVDALSSATEAAREVLPGSGGKMVRDDYMMSTFGVFAAGIVLGAGLAMLFAPKPGAELRGAIGEKISSLRPTSENLRPAADA